jgi:cytochrome b-561
MLILKRKLIDSTYPILLGIVEVFGVLSIILVGLLFPKNGKYGSYNWETNSFSYHPLMMTIGLLFCYGNAIILYRTFRQSAKYPVKLFHAFLLIASLIFAAVGLAAIIRSKIIGKRPHFMTYHTWIGLATIILFTFQWICGFVSFLFPQLSLNLRQRYMPTYVFIFSFAKSKENLSF